MQYQVVVRLPTAPPPPLPAQRGGGRSERAGRALSRRELALLRALVAFPWATDRQLGAVVGLPRATVTRQRIRLLDDGVVKIGYSPDLHRLHSGQIAATMGRAAPGTSDRELAHLLERLLRDHGVSGAILVEGGAFVGALFDGAHGKLPLWSADALAMHRGGNDGYLVSSVDTFAFPKAPSVARVALDFRPLLDQVAGRQPLHSTPKPRPGPRPTEERPLRRTEAVVARTLIEDPDLAIPAGAARAGVSRSTFAHVKSALLARGLLKEEPMVDVRALGFPLLLAVGLYRRPRREKAPRLEAAELLSRGTAPISRFASPTHELTITPFREPAEARGALRALESHASELELLAPPFAATFHLGKMWVVTHSQPGDLTASWVGSAA